MESNGHRHTKEEGGVMAGLPRSDWALPTKLGSRGRPEVVEWIALCGILYHARNRRDSE